MDNIDELLSERHVNSSATDVLAEPLIGDKKPIRALYEQSWEADDPPSITEFIGIVCNTKPISFFGEEFNTVGGISTDPDEARRKAIGEAIERYCMSISLETELVHGTADVINAVDPEVFNKTSNSIPLDNTYYWVSAYDILDEKRVRIPSQFVYVPAYSTGEFIRSPISTGAACHLTPRDAFTAGLLEAVERDAFMIHYQNRIPGRELTVDLLCDHCETVSEIEEYGFDIQLLYLQVDIPVHVVLCILWDTELSYFQLGLSAGFSLDETAFSALIESFQGRHWLRKEANPPAKINTIEQRAAFWRTKENLQGVEHWRETTVVSAKDVSSVDTVEQLISEIQSKGMDLFVADLTTPDVAAQDFTVLKTIVPQLEPLYLDETYRHVGGERLYEAPVTAGLLDQHRSPDKLNEVPHPFI